MSHPGIAFSLLGGQIAVLGNYDGLSFYNSVNDSDFLTAADSDNQYLYLRNTSSKSSEVIATIAGGSVTLLTQLSDELVLVGGTFTTFNGVEYLPPIIYNVSSTNVTSIFSLSSKRDASILGTVKTSYVDGDLIYLGGDFDFDDTHGAAVYNITSQTTLTLPFLGFGDNSTINSITKYSSGEDDEGSIIFGGSFNTLGLEQLLMHNISFLSNSTNSTNSTNTSLIAAEQVVSLKLATFTNVNGASGNDDSAVICPSNDDVWSLEASSGGQWAAELPLGMRDITPTKVRIYVPQSGSDGIQTFRIYTYPNNGIMNLTYVNPETNELSYCDASCPLLLGSDLKDITDNNIDERESLSDDDTIYVDESGSYSIYYDLSTKAKSLGYGSNYQEFALVDALSINKIALTTISWYGSKGEFSGFELYLDAISVYGNDTLNESNCGSESADDTNTAVVDDGDWVSISSLNSAIDDTNYVVSVVDNSTASMTLYPNISYAGYYSILFYTPGCSADDSCSYRSIVNVSLIDTDDQILASQSIYQNNLADKFDYLFYGHLEGSSSTSGRNKVKIEYESLIDSSANQTWVVVDKVVANIVSLDTYYSKNSTNSTDNSTSTNYELQTMSLNGLFEYSLANFSSFSTDLVYSGSESSPTILDTNTFVGNSTINLLSGELSENSTVSQLVIQNGTDSTNLLVLGDFASENITILNSNLLTLAISGYSTTYNETEANFTTRRLRKRDETTYLGATFNDTILNIVSVNNGFIALGEFTATDNSTGIKNLENGNSSTTAANNFLYNSNGDWYSFGNSYFDEDFSQFASVDLLGVEYYIFSTLNNSYKVWDNTNFHWPSSSKSLQISAAVDVDNGKQQIIGGSSFGTMLYTGDDVASFKNNTAFSSLGLNVTDGSILISYYVNSTFSVVGGIFSANLSIDNVAIISNNIGSPLAGDPAWNNDTAVTALYVDTNDQYLFIGTNGSVEIDSSSVSGLTVYSLKNGSFASVQPPDLSTSDSTSIKVTSLAYYDDSSQLLVGGHFDSAGSLGCASVCIYDIANTRWTNPLSSTLSASIGGDVTNAKFVSSTAVLLSGNLTLDGTSANFVVYDFSKGAFEGASSALNSIGISDSYVETYIINENSDSSLEGRMCAYGSDFVIGFDGSAWSRIDDGIELTDNSVFTDLKLVDLSSANSANSNETYFDEDKALLLAGAFNLTDYGFTNVAIFDGSSWTPYIFASQNSSVGSVNSLLFEDIYRFQSSSDVSSSKKQLSSGQIVGISLACAIGSTALLGLLYLIPMFFLFDDSRKNDVPDQRIHEDEMMNIVNPEDLFHEMDMQRNH